MRKIVLLLAAIVPAAWSAPVVGNAAGPDVSLGAAQLFAERGVTMTSFGFDDAASTPLDLYKKNDRYEKNDPNDENGVGDELALGFLGTIDHEIELNRYIQLNLQNLWTADPSSVQVSTAIATAGEGDESFGSNTLEIQSGSLNSTADNLTSSEETYGYNSAPVSTDDAAVSPLSGGNAFTWGLGALLASALVGLWLFLRGVLLTMRPSARPVRHVRA